MPHPHLRTGRPRPAVNPEELGASQELERGAPFCANPHCALHVRLVDAGVAGGGNWVHLPDGRVFGRGRYGDELLCDACGTRRGPLHLADLRN